LFSFFLKEFLHGSTESPGRGSNRTANIFRKGHKWPRAEGHDCQRNARRSGFSLEIRLRHRGFPWGSTRDGNGCSARGGRSGRGGRHGRGGLSGRALGVGAVPLAGGTPARAGGTPALPRKIERGRGVLRSLVPALPGRE
jgi:hypothetical protein